MKKGSKRLGVLVTAGMLTIAGGTAAWAADAESGQGNLTISFVHPVTRRMARAIPPWPKR